MVIQTLLIIYCRAMFKLFQILQFTFLFFFISSSDILAQQFTDTSKVLVKFNEPMSRDGIFNIENYTLYRDEKTTITIYKVGVVAGDTAVVLYTEKYNPQSSYKLIINNLKDKSGNEISESHKMAFY